MSALSTQEGGSHYKGMAIQPAEFTTKNGIGHLAGDAIAYICRYKRKNGVEDLRKAIHSLELLIELEYGADRVPCAKPLAPHPPLTPEREHALITGIAFASDLETARRNSDELMAHAQQRIAPPESIAP